MDMKRDARTGRFLTTGRTTVRQSGASFDRVRSKSGDIIAVNTKRVSESLRRSGGEVVVHGRDGRIKGRDSHCHGPQPRSGRKH